MGDLQLARKEVKIRRRKYHRCWLVVWSLTSLFRINTLYQRRYHRCDADTDLTDDKSVIKRPKASLFYCCLLFWVTHTQTPWWTVLNHVISDNICAKISTHLWQFHKIVQYKLWIHVVLGPDVNNCFYNRAEYSLLTRTVGAFAYKQAA